MLLSLYALHPKLGFADCVGNGEEEDAFPGKVNGAIAATKAAKPSCCSFVPDEGIESFVILSEEFSTLTLRGSGG